jgi:excisionase family DNA binding protein
MSITPPVWMTSREAAEYARCSVRTLTRAAAAGALKQHRQTRAIRYRRDELDAWMTASQEPAETSMCPHCGRPLPPLEGSAAITASSI